VVLGIKPSTLPLSHNPSPRIYILFFLNVWFKSAVKPSGIEVSFVEKFLAMNLIILIDVGLLPFYLNVTFYSLKYMFNKPSIG
jgi:hypothetical protein